MNFESLQAPLKEGDWDTITKALIEKSKQIEQAGAGFLLIASNAAHKVASEIKDSLNIPFLHIATPIAKAIEKDQVTKVGIIGTSVTMNNTFYKDKLNNQVELITPDKEEQNIIQNIIFKDLLQDKLEETTKKDFLSVVSHLQKKGAQKIILGCTELTDLAFLESPSLFYDSTVLYAKAAVDYSLQ